MNIGLYIHIPFCRKKCDYCSFYSIPVHGIDNNRKNDLFDRYIKTLLLEIDLRASELKDYRVDTVYFGGGTPSLVSPLHLDKILNHIDKRLSINACEEITIECNPDTFSISLLERYKTLGINRAILGVQTLNERCHTIIGRAAPLCDLKIISDFIGISGIAHCTDIIFGIPGQTWEMLYSDLKDIVNFKPEHISAYTLTVESDTPLFVRKNLLPDFNDNHRDIFESAIDYLKSKGYIHYEVSNYALPGFESKHNLKYWKFLPYAGFGPGAHSFYNNERYYNQCSVEEYIKNKGEIRQRDIRTKNSQIAEFIFSGMRLIDGILLSDFKNKLGINIPDELMNKFIEMKNSNLLFTEECKGDIKIKFTRDGFFQMDGLIYEMTEMFL